MGQDLTRLQRALSYKVLKTCDMCGREFDWVGVYPGRSKAISTYCSDACSQMRRKVVLKKATAARYVTGGSATLSAAFIRDLLDYRGEGCAYPKCFTKKVSDGEFHLCKNHSRRIRERLKGLHISRLKKLEEYGFTSQREGEK